MAVDELNVPKVTPKDTLEAYLSLCRQQMDHYHKLQQVEWRGTFGAWTLMAGAAYFTVQHDLHLGMWAMGGLIIAVIHSLWLLAIYRTEEFDKALWTHYRAQVLRILNAGALDEVAPGEQRYALRSRGKELKWLALEAGVTWFLALVTLRAF